MILLLVYNPGRLPSNPYAVFILQRVLIVFNVLLNSHFKLLYHNFDMLKLERLLELVKLFFRDLSIIKLSAISTDSHKLLQFLDETSELIIFSCDSSQAAKACH